MWSKLTSSLAFCKKDPDMIAGSKVLVTTELERMFEKRDKGRVFYEEKVFNKMKPNSLFISVASHPLKQWYIIWVDENIMSDMNLNTVEVLNKGGF